MFDKELNLMITSLEKSKVTYPKVHQLRCSSLPWCGLHSFVHDTDRTDSYTSDFYTSIGTAIHETIQKWLAIDLEYARDVYAHWVCSDPKCKHDHGECWHPGECSACKSTKLTYNECTITYRSLTGHTDLIRRINNKNHAVLIDFKSTDLFKDVKQKGFRSWTTNFEVNKRYPIQIRSYCALLRKTKKLDIRGWMLTFIDRATPPNKPNGKPKIVSEKWTPSLQKEFMNYLDSTNENWKTFEKLQIAISEGDKGEASDCLKSLIVNRPCQSRDDYDSWMTAAFFDKDKDKTKRQCPSLKFCSKAKKGAIYSHMLDCIEKKNVS